MREIRACLNPWSAGDALRTRTLIPRRSLCMMPTLKIQGHVLVVTADKRFFCASPKEGLEKWASLDGCTFTGLQACTRTRTRYMHKFVNSLSAEESISLQADNSFCFSLLLTPPRSKHRWSPAPRPGPGQGCCPCQAFLQASAQTGRTLWAPKATCKERLPCTAPRHPLDARSKKEPRCGWNPARKLESAPLLPPASYS